MLEIMAEPKIKLEKKVYTLVDQIVENLQDRILKDKIKAGDMLSEPQLAKEFGVSRGPVREALIILEEQLLLKKTYLGREIVKFSEKDIREWLEIKNGLEIMALKKLLQFPSTHTLTLLRKNLEKSKKVGLSNLKLLLKSNSEFHDLLISSTANESLNKIYRDVVRKVRWFSSLSISMPQRPQKSLAEHQKILRALQKKSPLAESYLNAHATGTMERILSQLKRSGRI